VRSVKEKRELVIFETNDSAVKLEVPVENETVWLTQAQMAELFDTSKQNISLHINNCFKEGELEKDSVVKDFLTTAADGKRYKTKYYNLDVIISVGYRVKSKRGVEFRKWANSVLKQYILQGYAVNNNRIAQLGEVVQIMKRTQNELDSRQVLNVIQKYSKALDLLDSYDHQTMERPEGNAATYELTYEECMDVISIMRFGAESDLFGREKDDSFRGSIGNIYQSYAGQELYPTLEEKAAHLLYFVTKNHSFLDGNKRIAATMFLYFLDKNGVLFAGGEKLIDDHTLVALTIMIAESKPEEKDMMITVIMNCLKP
jgi:prophage maintenance system killer protein